MITEKEFENLINKCESSILDFKSDTYDFSKQKNIISTSKFVKDVISFSNTIRTETSYIIFGISELENGEYKLNGISKNIDDAILQDKIKDKLIPRPIFSYYTIKYTNKLFGILEFPIYKYEMPITPSVSLKGLEPGKVYYRNGTSNTEANAFDVIRINDWIKKIPDNVNINSLNSEITKNLNALSSKELKLSVVITNLLSLSKEYNLDELNKFCKMEMNGIKVNESGNINYRAQKVIISWDNIEINPYSYIKPTAELVRKEMENKEGFFERKIIMHHPIFEIESSLERFEKDPNKYATMNTNTKTLLGMKKKYDLYIYLFENNFHSLYINIRQRAIDILMKL